MNMLFEKYKNIPEDRVEEFKDDLIVKEYVDLLVDIYTESCPDNIIVHDDFNIEYEYPDFIQNLINLIQNDMDKYIQNKYINNLN